MKLGLQWRPIASDSQSKGDQAASRKRSRAAQNMFRFATPSLAPCRWLQGTSRRSTAAGRCNTTAYCIRVVVVPLDASSQPALPWHFRLAQRIVLSHGGCNGSAGVFCAPIPVCQQEHGMRAVAVWIRPCGLIASAHGCNVTLLWTCLGTQSVRRPSGGLCRHRATQSVTCSVAAECACTILGGCTQVAHGSLAARLLRLRA